MYFVTDKGEEVTGFIHVFHRHLQNTYFVLRTPLNTGKSGETRSSAWDPGVSELVCRKESPLSFLSRGIGEWKSRVGVSTVKGQA